MQSAFFSGPVINVPQHQRTFVAAINFGAYKPHLGEFIDGEFNLELFAFIFSVCRGGKQEFYFFFGLLFGGRELNKALLLLIYMLVSDSPIRLNCVYISNTKSNELSFI